MHEVHHVVQVVGRKTFFCISQLRIFAAVVVIALRVAWNWRRWQFCTSSITRWKITYLNPWWSISLTMTKTRHVSRSTMKFILMIVWRLATEAEGIKRNGRETMKRGVFEMFIMDGWTLDYLRMISPKKVLWHHLLWGLSVTGVWFPNIFFVFVKVLCVQIFHMAHKVVEK